MFSAVRSFLNGSRRDQGDGGRYCRIEGEEGGEERCVYVLLTQTHWQIVLVVFLAAVKLNLYHQLFI